jgi:hypothetical protein
MKKRIFFLLALVLMPAMAFANGGDQRVVQNTYLINLSRAPFTPRVGVKISFLASFVDLESNKLIAEDLIVKVRIAKLGGGDGKREFLFERDKILVKGGVMELAHTFSETGLHEIFFDFAFVSNPQNVYEAPDFLLDVQRHSRGYSTQQLFTAALAGLVIGLLVGWLVKRKARAS